MACFVITFVVFLEMHSTFVLFCPFMQFWLYYIHIRNSITINGYSVN